MSRKHNRARTQKSKRNTLNSQESSVSLRTNESRESVKIGSTFLGYKLKNVNQLWRWDTLEDVEFK